MLITLRELIDLAIMSLALGYIFMDSFRMQRRSLLTTGFDREGFVFSAMVVAPAIVLHELAHKFTAMGFGLEATFFTSYTGLLLGVVLKLFHSPFIFFVPGFVATSGGSSLQHAIIAFAGPGMNLVLWLGSLAILKRARRLTVKQHLALHITKQLNMLLFIFNMIPFPPFDGYHVISGLMGAFV